MCGILAKWVVNFKAHPKGEFLMKTTILAILILVSGLFALQLVFADSELPPVYQKGQVILDKYRYTLGDTITVTVISPLNNTDPNALDTVVTAKESGLESKRVVHLSGRSLTESGPDTGIFVGKFQITKPGDKPSANPKSVDGYLEVSPDSDSIAVMLKNIQDGGTSGMTEGYTHSSNQTELDGLFNRTISSYPNAQFRWKESISPSEGIGVIRVVYPEQNISDKVDSLVARLFHDSERMYVTLNETGNDTGVFETEIPVTTQYSPTKLTLKPSQWNYVSVEYYIDDHLSSTHNSFNLHSSLANPDSKPSDMAKPMTIQTNNDWYLSNQQIAINGQAEPDEDLNIVLFSKKTNGQEKFRHTKADHTGSFSASISWNETFSSGSHTIGIVGSKHGEMSTKDIMLVSLDKLRSHSIDVSPKQQLQMGILPEDIVCRQVWKIVLKPDGKTPTCLEPPTAFELEKRGWTILQKTIHD